jgi:hypothetical protein
MFPHTLVEATTSTAPEPEEPAAALLPDPLHAAVDTRIARPATGSATRRREELTNASSQEGMILTTIADMRTVSTTGASAA